MQRYKLIEKLEESNKDGDFVSYADVEKEIDKYKERIEKLYSELKELKTKHKEIIEELDRQKARISICVAILDKE